LKPPRVAYRVVALTAVVALAVVAILVVAFEPVLLGSLGAWPVFVAALLILIAALVALWIIQRRRDRTLW
jgi:lipopolysaccharide export LptBFGC system permease protein LptF